GCHRNVAYGAGRAVLRNQNPRKVRRRGHCPRRDEKLTSREPFHHCAAWRVHPESLAGSILNPVCSPASGRTPRPRTQDRMMSDVRNFMLQKIETENEAIKFIRRVKFALRYNSTPALPLASMYAAAHDQRRAIELTNALLARDEVIETNIIGDRLVLVHRDVVPALYVLRTRFRAAKLSDYAEGAFRLIRQDGIA